MKESWKQCEVGGWEEEYEGQDKRVDKWKSRGWGVWYGLGCRTSGMMDGRQWFGGHRMGNASVGILCPEENEGRAGRRNKRRRWGEGRWAMIYDSIFALCGSLSVFPVDTRPLASLCCLLGISQNLIRDNTIFSPSFPTLKCDNFHKRAPEKELWYWGVVLAVWNPDSQSSDRVHSLGHRGLWCCVWTQSSALWLITLH